MGFQVGYGFNDRGFLLMGVQEEVLRTNKFWFGSTGV